MASSSSSDLFSMIWNPYQIIQQAVLPYHKSLPTTTIIDLNDYCLMNIYQYLDLENLIHCRCVCHRFYDTIEDYFKLKKKFIYDCRVNGIHLQHGQYQFNIKAFEFILEHMPNIQVLCFEQCRMMRSSLAICQFNLFNSMSIYLNDLKELHLGRAFFVQSHSLNQLIKAFPTLTYLTITIYNEHLLSLILSGFKYLRYLNLDHSILYDYAPFLKNLPPTIRTFIPPVDIKNHKLKILKFLCDGHGINLERLELRINVSNVFEDRHYFDLLGRMLCKLKWLECDLSCMKMINPHVQSSMMINENIQEINNNSNHLKQLDEKENPQKEAMQFNSNYNNINYGLHLNLILGLHRLTNLRVLILKERDYFDTEYRCSLFNDYSLLKIFKNCQKLIMLSISCSLCCNRNDYARYTMNRKQDDQTINRILNNFAHEEKQKFNGDCDTTEENAIILPNKNNWDSSREMIDANNLSQCLVCNGCDNSNPPSNLYKFKVEEEQKQCLDSKIINNHEQQYQEYSHTITDHSLGTLDLYLPKLRILQLRGVQLGPCSFDSISHLTELRFLRLDSIKFEHSAHSVNIIKESFSELMHALTSSHHLNGGRRKIVIHLTNIPLI